MRIARRRAKSEDLRWWLAFLGAVLLIGLAVAALHSGNVRVCLLHRLTGLPCLTCGGTRAITALLKGDWLDALRIQPLVSALSVLLVGWLAANIFCWLVWRQCLSVTLSRTEWLILGMAALLLAVSNWVYLLWHGV